MQKVRIKIESNAPLLMNKWPLPEPGAVKKKGEIPEPKEDAEKKSHFDPKLGYYVPNDVIEGSLREAGKNIKSGRSSLKKTVQSSVFVPQEKIYLDRKDYDMIDSRYGRHPSTGNGILVSRVRFDKWALSFEVEFDEARISKNTLKALVEEAGAVIGIGSYRPKFGRFKLVEFE